MKLKKFKQRDPKKIGITVFTIVCVLLIAGVFFYTSFASFETHDEFNIIEGTVQSNGDVYFAYYVDGELTYTLPLQNNGYIFDEEKSNCANGATLEWDNSKWAPLVTNLTETRTKCTLYFKKTKTVNTVLGELEVYEYTPDFTKSACDDESCESHEKGIFETTDADGTTYYYRGSVENNYFKFADLWWRIIRINGDGSIRLIYDGTKAHDNGESSTDRQIGTNAFNSSYTDNMYVGYMYTSGDVHGTGTSSAIKTVVDTFYDQKLTSYASYIDIDAGFCGDRSNLNNQTGVGTGNATTYYKGYVKVLESTPDLTCENTNDLYTLSTSSKGNKALSKPIGLITADEVLLSGSSGGVFDGSYNHQKTNPNGYLTTGNTFWTMTPAGGYVPFVYTEWRSNVFNAFASGVLDDDNTMSPYSVRPVINIRKDVTITGEGTKEKPYQIS